MGKCDYYLKEYEEAETYFLQAHNLQSSQEVLDYIERCDIQITIEKELDLLEQFLENQKYVEASNLLKKFEVEKIEEPLYKNKYFLLQAKLCLETGTKEEAIIFCDKIQDGFFEEEVNEILEKANQIVRKL